MRSLSKFSDLFPSPLQAAIALLMIVAAFVAAQQNYLLFHTVAEGFAIIVAALIYVLATTTHRHSGEDFLLFLGNAYFFVAILDFLHTMTYQGMGVFIGLSANTATQIWIASRYLDALSLVIAPLYLRRAFPRKAGFIVYAVVTAISIASIMVWRVFPDAFVPGVGLTPFKVVSEYVISGLLLVGIWHLHSRRSKIDRSVYLIVVAAMGVTILAELSFTLYSDVYGAMNFVGHVFKVIAYYLIFKGIVAQGLEAPYTEVKRLNEELEQRVADRTAKLELEVAERKRAEEELRQSESFREQYISLVSHDLRSPLTSMLGISQLAEHRFAQQGLEQEARKMGIIVSNAQRMAAMISDLAESARLEAGQLNLSLEPADLRQMVVDLVERLPPEDSHRVLIEAEQGLPLIMVERDRIDRAITNLITNALKYSPSSTMVTVSLRQRDAEALLIVADQGIGIPAEDLPHVFERYYRSRTSEKREGLGLGLYITRMVVEAHGGRVWAESELDKGSKFYLSLPLISDAS